MHIKSNYKFQIHSNNNQRLVPLNAGHNILAHGNKGGIRTYGKIIGFILALFGKSVRLEDNTQRIYYVNKNSLKKWLQEQSGVPSRQIDLKKHGIDSVLNQIAQKAAKKQITEPKNENNGIPAPKVNLKEVINAYYCKTMGHLRGLTTFVMQNLNATEQSLKSQLTPLTDLVRGMVQGKNFVKLDEKNLGVPGVSTAELNITLMFLLKQGEIKAMLIPYEGTGFNVAMNELGLKEMEEERKPYLDALLADKDETWQNWNLSTMDKKAMATTDFLLKNFDQQLADLKNDTLPSNESFLLKLPPHFRVIDSFNIIDAIKKKFDDTPLFLITPGQLKAAFPKIDNDQLEAALRYGIRYSMIFAYRKTSEGFQIARSAQDAAAMRAANPGATIIDAGTLLHFLKIDRLIPLEAKKTTHFTIEGIEATANALMALLGLQDHYELAWPNPLFTKEQTEIALRHLVMSKRIPAYYQTNNVYHMYKKGFPQESIQECNLLKCLGQLHQIEQKMFEDIDEARQGILISIVKQMESAFRNAPGQTLLPLEVAANDHDVNAVLDVLQLMVKKELIYGWNIIKATNKTVIMPTDKDVNPLATKATYVFEQWWTKKFLAGAEDQ